MKITESDLFVFDLETTGTDPEKDRIVEFGATKFRGRDSEPKSLSIKVNPGVIMEDEVVAIHGITNKDVEFANDLEFYHRRISSAMLKEDIVVAGYNCLRFDVPMLRAEFARRNLDDSMPETLDPMVFVNWHYRGQRSRKLTAMCDLLGIEVANAHSASGDTLMTGLLLYRFIETGIIPNDFREAMDLQGRLAKIQENEFARWSYWLYQERDNGHKASGEIFMGAGKYCGMKLKEVPKRYIKYILGLSDTPDEAREILNGALTGNPGQRSLEMKQDNVTASESEGWGGWDA